MARNDMSLSSTWSRGLAAAALVWATVGCAAEAQKPEPTAGNDLVVCTEPRPQMCTMQYDPVCGRIGEGDGAAWKTYASGCTACGDPEVSAYRPGGECK